MVAMICLVRSMPLAFAQTPKAPVTATPAAPAPAPQPTPVVVAPPPAADEEGEFPPEEKPSRTPGLIMLGSGLGALTVGALLYTNPNENEFQGIISLLSVSIGGILTIAGAKDAIWPPSDEEFEASDRSFQPDIYLAPAGSGLNTVFALSKNF